MGTVFARSADRLGPDVTTAVPGHSRASGGGETLMSAKEPPSGRDPKATTPLGRTAAPLPAAPTFVLAVYHRDGASFVPLEFESSAVVGRERPADVVLADPRLSRQHARFVHDEDGLWVQDLGSTNGTEVEGKRIERARITPGLSVHLGTAVCTVYVRTTDEPELAELGGHDAFMEALGRAVAEARHFGDVASVLMLRASDEQHKPVHVSRWYQRALGALLPVDGLGSYSGQVLEILLPRTAEAEATRRAATLAKAAGGKDLQAVCAVATFPLSGASAEELLERCRQALGQARPEAPVKVAARAGFSEGDEGEAGTVLVAESGGMRELLATVERLSQASLPVLLLGETGTGKEVIARALHERGPRRSGPFVGLNCGAIPPQLVESTLFGHDKGAFTGADKASKGVFGTADGGTVLLDEIGDLPADAQSSLLRVLETGRLSRVGSAKEIPVDVRVIAATHRDLERMCQEGGFRQDLLFRINAATLSIPPLRGRREDIPALAHHFLERASRAAGIRRMTDFAPEAMQALERYRWPGNIRELRNAVERACVIAAADRIELGDLPERVRGPHARASEPPGPADAPEPADSAQPTVDLRTHLREVETQMILTALRAEGGNQTHAARRLGLPLRTLLHKMKGLGITKADYQS